MKIALSIPGLDGVPVQIDLDLPTGVKTGGIDTAGGIIVVFISILLFAAVLYGLWLILTGGIVMIMSRGNKEGFMKSWNKVLYAIIGLILVFFTLVVMNALGLFVGSPLLPFFN